MLSRSSRWLVLLVLGFFAIGTPAWSSQPPRNPARFRTRRLGRLDMPNFSENNYNIRNLKTISGIIEGIHIATPTAGTSGNIVEIILLGKSEKLCYVKLGPYWYIYSRQFKLAKGERVRVRGFLKLEGKDYHMLATELIREEDVLDLRDERGIPLWGTSPQEKTLSLGQVLSNRLQTPETTKDTKRGPREQRPGNYGPEYPDADGEEKEKKKGLTLFLAWFSQGLNTGLDLIGSGGRIIILFALVILMVFSLIRTYRPRNSWRNLKTKHNGFK